MGRLRLATIGCIILSLHITPTHGQDYPCVDRNAVDLNESLPFFKARFPHITVKEPTLNRWLGGRNQTYCCILAVNEYLGNNCTDSTQVHIDRRILDPNSQFSCGALWNGELAGAPEVHVVYAWAAQYCSGWEKSEAKNVDEWAQLLVGFILPSVVFSFNVPRPRKIKLPRSFFPTKARSLEAIGGFAGLVGTAIMVSLDTVVWLMVTFAFAGPLLLSGLYEAQLDSKVLEYLQKHGEHGKLPLGFRARVLFTILCGNLDLYPAWGDTMDLAKHLDDIDKSKALEEITSLLEPPHMQLPKPTLTVNEQALSLSPGASSLSRPRSLSGSAVGSASHSPSPSVGLTPNQVSVVREDLAKVAQDSVSFDMQGDQLSREDLMRQRSKDQPSILTRSDVSSLGPRDVGSFGETKAFWEPEGSGWPYRYDKKSNTIKKVTVRLRAMLSCQYSFGTTIGGPVVFFLGSFIYALIEIQQNNIGEENIAEALAFGMWWTIIPHVAAVAGLLLAGNNPNILEGIVGVQVKRYAFGGNLVKQPLGRRNTVVKLAKRSFSNIMGKVYEAEYYPAWMWDRGRCKQDWLLVLFTDSWLKYQQSDGLTDVVRTGLEDFLTDAIMLDLKAWIYLWLSALFMVAIPFIFAFLTAYFTPAIGIGCRSMTFLMYTSAQVLLLLLWAYYLTFRDNYWRTALRIKKIFKLGRGVSHKTDLNSHIGDLQRQAVRDTSKPPEFARSQDERVPLMSEDGDADAVRAMDHAHPVVKWLFYTLCSIGIVLAVVFGIVGTMWQLMGVYRNSLCLMPATSWLPASTREATNITLSTNTAEAIREARRHWLYIGWSSVIFLSAVCYRGWWYQKNLRDSFKKVAGQLDGDSEEYELEVYHE